jgi:three-Cys-motif partner protein
MTFRLPELEDDGLITPEVGAWGEEKYRLVGLYAEMFSKSMKGKWGSRVYLDLFAGAGRARIKDTKRILPASPLLALSVVNKFDKYIFCELDGEKIQALETRVKREFPAVDAIFVPGDTNQNIGEIMKKIPQHYAGHNVLCFCFVDPYMVAHLDFETIRRLSQRFVDFLVLIPSGMDAGRNVAKYQSGEASKNLDRFLGTDAWRGEWASAEARGENFEWFVRDQFGRQMAKLNYIYEGTEDMKAIRRHQNNMLLYRLAFFSRNDRGKSFWAQACKYSNDQRTLF